MSILSISLYMFISVMLHSDCMLLWLSVGVGCLPVCVNGISGHCVKQPLQTMYEYEWVNVTWCKVLEVIWNKILKKDHENAV